jgi:hypothetical protein
MDSAPTIRDGDALAVQVAREVQADHIVRLGGSNPRKGFVRVPRLGPVLAWRSVNRCAMPPLSNWSMTMGDIELF